MNGPNGMNIDRTRSTPLSVPRTRRMKSMYGLTSLPAGKMVPIGFGALLREDQVRQGNLRFSFEHTEMAEVLMNKVNVLVQAYFVPMLALERFNGSMDQLNRSYEGLPPVAGQPVVPFLETHAMPAHGANDVYKYLGLHAAPGRNVNTAYLEAYNKIWNFRAKNRSPKLTLRSRLDGTLAPAFWLHDQFSHMVPNVDTATIDGKVPLNVVNSKLPVRGIGMGTRGLPAVNQTISYGDKQETKLGHYIVGAQSVAANQASLAIHIADAGPHIFAEMAANGINISLSNIELARKTQAFAEVRKQFNALDEHIMNLLMDGIRVAEQELKNPILVGESRTFFGQSKRYASDAANLSVSAVDGLTQLEMRIRVPRMNTGGVVMLVAEITPDQLFERQEDPFFVATAKADLPEYLRDELDPEKIDIVKNSRIDTSHATPDGTFAYEPKNARWNSMAARVGGKYYRPTANTATDTLRQRIWAAEPVNPVLGNNFYLANDLHIKPFLNRNADPFEVIVQGDLVIEGNTVFGAHLLEAHPTNDYDKVFAEADQTRIEQTV